MPRKPFNPFVQAAIILLSVGVFIFLWPIVAVSLLFAIPGHTSQFMMCTMEEGATLVAIPCVGLPLGFHVGLMLAGKTAWMPSRGTRIFFLAISALFALFITYFDSTEGLDGPLLYKGCYFLAVQALPLFWFVYNLHGEKWLRMLATRRRRRQSERDALTSRASSAL